MLLGTLALGGAVAYALYHYGRDLPDYRQLAEYRPPTVSRIHAGDGRLLAEYARERRVFVPINSIPRPLINAFLAAEDKNFYTHYSIDPLSVVRAAIQNVQRLRDNRRPEGASTITQQVAKNFLLTSEVSYERKLKEALLAFRIERAFTKDQILELYLNEIYLGTGSYGVAAAALNYFNKALGELEIHEAAFLAALPKAPSLYHPERNHNVAKGRRDWVISRMEIEGFITPEEAQIARDEPLEMRRRDETEYVVADYFTEEVRRQLVARFGDDGFYESGFSVRTTLDPDLQAIAERSLRDGLVAFDRRTGFRGPLTHLELADGEDWQTRLARFEVGFDLGTWRKALVLGFDGAAARLGFEDGSEGRLPPSGFGWARPVGPDGRLGGQPERAQQILTEGDVVLVEPVAADDGSQRFVLRQVPEIQGALVALDPHTGRVLAMEGGFSQRLTQFNRATQALRQPGSAFKPFVYLAALEAGYTPSNTVLDAPISIEQGPGLPLWEPGNYSNDFQGPMTLRVALERSRNIPTVRLADEVGMDRVLDVAHRFGIERGLGRNLASVLGSNEVDLLGLTSAYATFVNGGRRVQPALIERIQDRQGRTVHRRDARVCETCLTSTGFTGEPPPRLQDDRPAVVDRRHAYQIVSILEGVVERGTGQGAKSIGKPVAGKTGTTNDYRDAWFVGFTPDLAVGVYLGYDQPRRMPGNATGGAVALPVFTAFMTSALEGVPAVPFRVPPELRLVRVEAATGRIPAGNGSAVILEAFLPGTEPEQGYAPPLIVGPSDLTASHLLPSMPEPSTPVLPGQGTGGVSSGLY